MNIIADDAIPFLKGVWEPYADIRYLPGSEISGRVLADADALLIRTRTKCTDTLLDQAPHLKFIASATIGMDHMDVKACVKRGIRCVNAPGCNAPSVAQYILSVLLADSVRHGHAPAGRTLGVIGAGQVGSRVAAAACKLGMHVLLNDPPRARREGSQAFTDLPELLKRSDIITLHTPLLRDTIDRTWHLANEEFFMRMEKHPLFINASRGEVTDPEALKSALITGKVRSAALDVWEGEPDIDTELLNMVDIATPHIAGYSADGKAMGTAMAVRQTAEFFGISELQNFFPVVPPPPDPVPEVTSLADAVFASYDVRQDDARLRRDPLQFESLRAHYPLRREFGAFTIRQTDRLPDGLLHTLKALGFFADQEEQRSARA